MNSTGSFSKRLIRRRLIGNNFDTLVADTERLIERYNEFKTTNATLLKQINDLKKDKRVLEKDKNRIINELRKCEVAKYDIEQQFENAQEMLTEQRKLLDRVST